MEKEKLYRFCIGEATEKEAAEIMEWTQKSPENERELALMQMVYDGALLYSVGMVNEKPEMILKIWKQKWLLRYAVAAAVLISTIIGLSVFTIHRDHKQWSGQMTTISIPAGQRIEMQLQDGTHVWLNAGTKFEYPPVFLGGERRVKIDGEALFEVTHDAKRPFIVETYAYDVEVLGTKFNVIAQKARNSFSTALLQGKVKVTDHRANEEILMNENEIIEYIGGSLQKSRIRGDEPYCWTKGLVCVDNLTFEELMQKFEQMYGVEIVIDRKELPKLHFKTGKFRVSDGIDHALTVLQASSGFNYERNQETGVIRIF